MSNESDGCACTDTWRLPRQCRKNFCIERGGVALAPVRSYTNWNSRTTDEEEQIEPYRKYFFICEGANTETWYFKKLIDIRKELNIHPLIDIRLLEKTDGDRDISFPRRLIEFAENQKENPEIAFDKKNISRRK